MVFDMHSVQVKRASKEIHTYVWSCTVALDEIPEFEKMFLDKYDTRVKFIEYVDLITKFGNKREAVKFMVHEEDEEKILICRFTMGIKRFYEVNIQ